MQLVNWRTTQLKNASNDRLVTFEHCSFGYYAYRNTHLMTNNNGVEHTSTARNCDDCIQNSIWGVFCSCTVTSSVAGGVACAAAAAKILPTPRLTSRSFRSKVSRKIKLTSGCCQWQKGWCPDCPEVGGPSGRGGRLGQARREWKVPPRPWASPHWALRTVSDGLS